MLRLELLRASVSYKALYGEGDVWLRPAGMWNEEVVPGVLRFMLAD